MKTLKSKITVVIASFLVIGAAFGIGTGVHLVANTASAAPTLYSQDTTTSIYNNASPAVVEINVTQTVNTVFGNSTQAALGSGFLIDNLGDILTNNHVVDGTATVQVTVKFLAQTRSMT